ncbi:MAG: DUF493 domain-containing protein [Pseudomonadales bacterium]|jgi:putative lipoic acid-binding regulatory protein|nr:DUF493 domain-containing protein [Pseudomonadales bacterium]MDG1441719.1 DUF493 domain-containing protein [Pseudomonadales bacterium]
MTDNNENDAQPEEPKIVFPCDYPIKVIVQSEPGIEDTIFNIVKRHDMRLSLADLSQMPSKKGKYVSLRFGFWATGKTQLDELFEDLKQCEAVQMVL